MIFAPRPRTRRSIWAKLLPFALLATLLLAASSASAATGPRFAIINLGRAIGDTEDGIRMKAQLRELFDARQNEYVAKEKAVAAARTKFEALSKSKKTPVGTLRKKYQQLEKLALDLQQAQVSYQREMRKKEFDLTDPIKKSVLSLVRQLSSQNGYDLVVNYELSVTGLPTVPYYRRDLDITDRIVQLYNARSGSPATKKKAPARKKKVSPRGAAKPNAARRK